MSTDSVCIQCTTLVSPQTAEQPALLSPDPLPQAHEQTLPFSDEQGANTHIIFGNYRGVYAGSAGAAQCTRCHRASTTSTVRSL
jgi:hypothetical protein